MKRAILFIFFAFLLVIGVPVFASVPSDGSADGSVPAPDPAIGGAVPETKPEPQAVSVPATELATTSAAVSAEPRSVPTPAPSPSAPAPAPGLEDGSSAESPIELPVETPPDASEPVSPWVWLAGLLVFAGGGLYGAYSFMKGMQTKNAPTGNTCDAIQETLNQKQYELSLVDHELSFYEEALKVLEEKAKDTVESQKNKIIKNVEAAAKDTLLGKKGESDARAAFDAAQKAKETYDDIEKKIEKTKKMLEMLRGKHGGLSAEAKTLEASYAACVARLPEAAKALAADGLTIVVPGSRPVRAIIFDWAGVIAAEAFWIWSRKNTVDISPILAVDMSVNTGEMPHDEFVAVVAKAAGTTPAEAWAGIKKEMVLSRELIALIRELKKKYKIGLLSNFTAPWLREVMDENQLWDLFDEHIISSAHKLVKPDAKIFKKILSMLDVAPDEAIFADDRRINIDGAKKAGIRAVLFTDVEQFKKDLKRMGVSVKPEEEDAGTHQ